MMYYSVKVLKLIFIRYVRQHERRACTKRLLLDLLVNSVTENVCLKKRTSDESETFSKLTRKYTRLNAFEVYFKCRYYLI